MYKAHHPGMAYFKLLLLYYIYYLFKTYIYMEYISLLYTGCFKFVIFVAYLTKFK